MIGRFESRDAAKLWQVFTESVADDILIIDQDTLKNIHCIVIYIYREMTEVRLCLKKYISVMMKKIYVI